MEAICIRLPLLSSGSAAAGRGNEPDPLGRQRISTCRLPADERQRQVERMNRTRLERKVSLPAAYRQRQVNAMKRARQVIRVPLPAALRQGSGRQTYSASKSTPVDFPCLPLPLVGREAAGRYTLPQSRTQLIAPACRYHPSAGKRQAGKLFAPGRSG